MARIVVTADTENDTLEVLVNGDALTNVQSVNFSLYNDYDDDQELSVSISMLEKSKETGITQVTYLTASEDKQSLTKGADDEPYGDVKYADPGYQKDKKKRYPIDTEEHIRAAWSYINKEKDGDKYSSKEIAAIKAKIISAWKAKIDKAGPPSASSASASDKLKSDIAKYFQCL